MLRKACRPRKSIRIRVLACRRGGSHTKGIYAPDSLIHEKVPFAIAGPDTDECFPLGQGRHRCRPGVLLTVGRGSKTRLARGPLSLEPNDAQCGRGPGLRHPGDDAESLEERPLPLRPGYIPFHPNPSKPTYAPPAGAVCAHCHVFGPEAAFPFAPKRKYTPCDAPKQKLFALRDFLGLDKNVIVQATCHDTDNRALVDALVNSHGRAKGVAFVDESFTVDQLKDLDRAGVKGVRFNFIKRLVDSTPKDVMQRIAARIADLGWHIVIYFEHADLDEMGAFLKSLPTTLVFDHMACPNVREGVDG